MATANQANSTNSSDKLKQAYSLASEAASDLMDGVKEKAQIQYEANKGQAAEVAKKAGNFIQERPLTSVGCAFAAGWLVSKILK